MSDIQRRIGDIVFALNALNTFPEMGDINAHHFSIERDADYDEDDFICVQYLLAQPSHSQTIATLESLIDYLLIEDGFFNTAEYSSHETHTPRHSSHIIPSCPSAHNALALVQTWEPKIDAALSRLKDPS